MTPNDLRAKAKAATPGPWERHGGSFVAQPASDPHIEADSEADAAYIAAASPDVLLGLLDDIEHEREGHKNAVDNWNQVRDERDALRARAEAAERRIVEEARVADVQVIRAQAAERERDELRAEVARLKSALDYAWERVRGEASRQGWDAYDLLVALKHRIDTEPAEVRPAQAAILETYGETFSKLAEGEPGTAQAQHDQQKEREK